MRLAGLVGAASRPKARLCWTPSRMALAAGAVAVLAAGLLAVPAAAGIKTGQHVVNVGMGMSVPLSDIDTSPAGGGMKKFAADGVFSGAQYIYHATPYFGLGFDLSGSVYEEADIDLPTRRAKTDASVFVAQGLMRYVVLPDRRVTPFFHGGFGINVYTARIRATPKAGFPWPDNGSYEQRVVFKNNAAGMAAMLGGGFEFYLTEKLLMDVEGRWNFCSIPTIEFGTDSATFVSSSVRLGWVFGE